MSLHLLWDVICLITHLVTWLARFGFTTANWNPLWVIECNLLKSRLSFFILPCFLLTNVQDPKLRKLNWGAKYPGNFGSCKTDTISSVYWPAAFRYFKETLLIFLIIENNSSHSCSRCDQRLLLSVFNPRNLRFSSWRSSQGFMHGLCRLLWTHG